MKSGTGRVCTAATLLFAWWGTDSAHAESRAPAPSYPPCTQEADDAALQAAQGAFEAGKAAFNEADYPRAILYWEDAYRRDCSAHLMLKNLARAYEGNEQHEHAAIALSTFLERVPDTGERADIEADISRLRQLSRRKPHKPVAGTPEPALDEQSQPGDDEDGSAAQHSALFESDTRASDGVSTTSSSPYELAAPLLAVAGAAVAVTSGVLWANARADEADAAEQCPSREMCPKEVEEAGNDAIDRQQLWSIIGAGGALMLTGGVLWYLLTPAETDVAQDSSASSTGRPRTRAYTAVVPRVGPGFVGLDWAARF